MEIKIGDVLVMKKPHPCGSFEFTVLRVGMDFRLRCAGCGHEFLISRQKAEKSTRQVVSKESTGESL